MSGIAGVVYYDGRNISDDILGKMLDSMIYRGPDGSSFVNLGNVGFIHLMSQNLPESATEILPFLSSDNRYLITFHGRIDNRKDIYVLTDRSHPLSELSDSQLVLASYLRFGKDCAGKLLGDFAFAIWDKTERLLYCCRDQMGLKPLYFIKTPCFFAFASEIKALLTLPGLSRELNRERLADFLVCIATERRMTIYDGIFKLQPAHHLVLHNDYLTESRYWQLEPYDLRLSSEKEYDDAFYEIFKEAVKVRLRSCKPVGSYLSGGIDSSSIVCMAAGPLESEYPGTLNTFTGIYPRLTICDERQYFQSVIDRYPILPNFIHGDDLLPELAFDTICNDEDEPFCSPHSFDAWHLMGLAQEKGIRIMLDGHDGDAALSRGEGFIPELAMQGRVFRMASELMHFPHSTRTRVLRSIKNIYIDILRQKLPFTNYTSSAKRLKLQQLEILSPDLLKTTNVKERILDLIEVLPNGLQKEQKRHYLNISQPFHAYAIEFLERSTSRFKLSCRLPMFDIRIIAFCLSLPAEKKLKNGYNRYIVRKSLNDILPASIRERKEKTNFAPNLVEAFTVRSKDWLVDSFHDSPPGIYQFINKTLIAEALERCISGRPDMSKLSDVSRKIPDVVRVILFLSLSKWMKKTGVGC